MSAPAGAFVAVDWGTSSLRLWMLGAAGEIIGETRSRDGMQVVAAGGFEAVLRDRLADLAAQPGGSERPLKVVMCGMVGARQGWREAGYLDVPAPLAALTDRATEVVVDGIDARILPGLARRQADRPDVMRGEETQLLGLALADPGVSGLVCMPGTHCKWVTLDAGAVTDFETAMTGELFAVLAGHSILRHTIAGAAASGDPDAAAFRQGLTDGLSDPARLSARLFSIRAGGLLNGLEGPAAADRLSGLLIGAEVGSALARAGGSPVRLVAAGRLAALYGAAFAATGRAHIIVDADTAVRAGLLYAAGQLWAVPVETPAS